MSSGDEKLNTLKFDNLIMNNTGINGNKILYCN